MRSLSPSRTFTCTRTVSPDFIAGRSASCDFSTSSIAPIGRLLESAIAQFFENPLFLVVQFRSLQKLGAARQRPCERLPLPPPPYFGVVPRQQHLGHPQHAIIAELGRTS